jgi:C1A family cysteine protease
MVSFDELNARLRASSATWTARQTPQFLLSDEQKARLLGVVVNQADLAAVMAPRAQVEAPNFAPAVDWRNHNGNHVTSVKDQAGCGSCVSFCTVATVESMASIELGQKLNLSEADLHFCSEHGPSCGGWWPTNAYNVLKNRGVADEACFPYPVDAAGNVNPACATCADRDARAVKITESTILSSATERKNWLTNVGPCCAVIRVFDDFFAYGGGVYRHIVDNNPNTPDDVERGLHCVEIIGYSESEQCWIGKNSWGIAWGDQGFFKIGYGEIGIDTDFPFWTARGVKVPTSKLAQAMWIHGHSIQIESPEAIARLWKAGFYAEVEGKPGTNNWLHFAIPSKVIVKDRRLRVGSVMLLLETLSAGAIVRDVHIYDGDTKIAQHNGVNVTGNAGFVRFDVPTHPPVKWGIGISVGVTFKSGSASRVMRFKSAGCDFIA